MKKRPLYSLEHYGRFGGAPHFDDYIGGACDSRLVQPRNLFFALKGDRADGHDHLQEAAQKGAAAAIVRHTYRGPHFGLPLLFVNDPLFVLQQLAADLLAQLRARVVGVTGSVGKTTTKEFLSTVLSGRYKVLSTPGNANSQVGLPLALINGIEGGEEIVVCEMGMTHPGNISNLVRIAPPYLAIITAVEYVHACNFDGLEEIAKAKAEILSHPSTTLGLINSAMPFAEELSSRLYPKIFTFGTSNNNGYFRFENGKEGPLRILHNDRAYAEFPPLHLPGRHNNDNFMIAAAAAYLLGMSWDEISARQQFLKLPEKRLQFVEKKGVLFVNDSYNASLVAVKAAIDAMPPPGNNGRKYFAFGGMLELGSLAESHHRQVGEYALPGLDGIFCLGDECSPVQDVWEKAGKPCRLFMNHDDMVQAMRDALKPGDVVLVKGSRLKQMWRVIDEI